MQTPTAPVREAGELLASLADDVRAIDAIADCSDAELVELLQAFGALRRRVDALAAETVGEVLARSDGRAREERLTVRAGAGTPHELVQRALLVDRAETGRVVAAAQGVRREALFDRSRRPARFAAQREALLDGELSLSGFLKVARKLDEAAGRLVVGALEEADAMLADLARGVDYVDAVVARDGGGAAAGEADEGLVRMRPLPEDLAGYVDRVLAHLDPDGPEPREHAAFQRRFLTVGEQRDGLVPLRGLVVPEAAAQLLRISDAIHNPKVSDGPRFEPTDPDQVLDDADDGSDEGGTGAESSLVGAARLTRGQRLHDVLATALNIAARADEMPLLGGAAPTLVVAIDAGVLAGDAGEEGGPGAGMRADAATLEGTAFSAGIAVAEQACCTGVVQRVFHERGRIVRLETVDRVFNAPQRRAIAWRDRECVIPGCHVPSTWTEIHHVQEHALGGRTHTDNGVALCFAHHRTLHVNGWQVRMREGRPEIRGPAIWDPAQKWRRPDPSRWIPTGPPRTAVRRT